MLRPARLRHIFCPAGEPGKARRSIQSQSCLWESWGAPAATISFLGSHWRSGESLRGGDGGSWDVAGG